MYIKRKRSLNKRELEEKIDKIFLKINLEISKELVKVYDKYIDYKSEEFYKFLSENQYYESLIYDNKYEFELENKGLSNEEEKLKFKKEYTEKLLDSVSEKYVKQRVSLSDLEKEFNEIITKKVKQYGLDPKEYLRFIHLNNHSEMNLIEYHLPKDYFEEKEEFLKNFKKNYNDDYLKIISNWYFLALRKTQANALELKKSQVTNDFEYYKSNLLNLYEKNLEISLQELISFFQISETTLLFISNIVTSYKIYFSPFHPWRIKLDELIENIGFILHDITRGFKFYVFLRNEDMFSKPYDGIIDFEFVLNSRIELDN